MRLHAYIHSTYYKIQLTGSSIFSPRTPSIILSLSLASQIPRYIITLHELLAHTPPDHVEKNSLEHARRQLEDLSRQMHDEVRDGGGRAGWREALTLPHSSGSGMNEGDSLLRLSTQSVVQTEAAGKKGFRQA